MLESIIDFINLKLGLLNYFEKTHCLSTLVKNDDGLIYPAEYISNGDFEAVDFDAYDGVSYLRVNGDIDVSRTDENRYTPSPRVDVTIPLRLVYAVRKEKLTVDDAYSFDRVRGTIVKQLEVDAQDLVNQLNVDKVTISTNGYKVDAQEIWSEETNETGLFQPKFELVFGSMEVEVTVRAKANCIPTECDDVESDILKTFNFCSQVTQQRLTQTQVDCLTTWLCGASDPVTIQINGVTYTTANAGDTFNQQIHDSAGNDVGTTANPSVVSDASVSINSTPVDTVEAEGSVDLTVNLDGSPSGSWNGTSWEVTSAACADATVNVNGVFMDTIPSGGSENIQVRQETGATLVGSKQGQYWRIDDSQAQVNGVNTETIPATETHNQQIHNSLGSDVGTAANPSVVSDTTITNKLTGSTWSDTVEAEGTYALTEGKALDSDGVTDLTALYIPSSQGYMFTCSPADYGTRILSILRRKYCQGVMAGFSFQYIEDEFATAGSAVIRVRRSSDNSEADFTPSEITDGTLTTWVGVGNDGHVQRLYDQSRNSFELFNNTAGNQAKIVTAGVLNTDAAGNPTAITTNTQGYYLGANGSNQSQLPLFSEDSSTWGVYKRAATTVTNRLVTIGGNPAYARCGSPAASNSISSGTATVTVNNTALADQNMNTLMSATDDTQVFTFVKNVDYTATGTWRTSNAVRVFEGFLAGSEIQEFVLSKKPLDTHETEIYNDRDSYYSF